MNGRTRTILDRLPAHFVATRSRDFDEPAKLLEAVVASLSNDLDELATDLAKTRRAHRIGHADTIIDVLRLAALHGMDDRVFGLLWQRIDTTRKRTAPADVLALFGLDTSALLAPDADPLTLWAPPGGTLDAAAATTRLLLHAAEAVRYRTRLERARARVTSLAAIHAVGNGTVDALLTAAAAALDLELDVQHNKDVLQQLQDQHATTYHPDLVSGPFLHSRDRYWHVSFVRDSFRLGRPVLAPGAPAPTDADKIPLAQRTNLVILDDPFDRITLGELARQLAIRPDVVVAAAAALTPPLALDPAVDIMAADAARAATAFGFTTIQMLPTARELLGIEENPLRREAATPVRAHDAQTFIIRRRGFGAALLRIDVTGIGDFTYGPMVVNRDAGCGIGFVGKVPDGKVIEFAEEGRVRLDGADVTSQCYAWRGGCFADAGDPRPKHDFNFAESSDATDARILHFATVEPLGALDRGAIFPTAGTAISVPPIGVGETRMAYFVRASHFGATPAMTTTPWIWNGAFDATVFAPSPGDTPPDSGIVALSWLEHEAYAVRIIVPMRFKSLDDGAPPERTVSALLQAAIDRVRPVGIDVRVDYDDEQWTLGSGSLPGANVDDPLIRITGGTLLWPTPTSQPT